MIHPTELFIGFRYLRAKRRTRFVSFITLVSMAGVALGVAALIVILSVMNGLESELRNRLLSMASHGQIIAVDDRLEDWRTVTESVQAHSGVVAAAPVVTMEGMIRSGSDLRAVLINGVEPALEDQLPEEPINMIEGNLDQLRAGDNSIALGSLIAAGLNLRIGDPVTVLIPRPVGDGTMHPELRQFRLVGVFEAGLVNHDGSLALVHLSDAAAIMDIGDAAQSIRFRADNVLAAPAIAADLAEQLGDRYTASDWTIENESYFRAIRLEKMMMSLMLSLIIGVAAFNIVASLVMVVTDKTNDIAVLRTLGMKAGGVVRVFFVQGAMIGWIGVLVGLVLGLVVAINVPTIVPALEQLFGFQVMPGDVFYQSRLPSEVEWQDVATITVTAFILTSIATLYPARRAAAVNPAVALRYE
ncbi:MAG: lipoprotein-releasing ABC transporter permease subunit [Pseudomonadota bacterium]